MVMVSSLCIAVLVGTVVQVLPTQSLTLRWIHTVEKTPWEEDWRIAGDALTIDEARVKGSGAGMDAPRGAVWSAGWWRYRPSIGTLEEVSLANSEFAPGYAICWAGACRPLQELAPRGQLVRLAPRPCAG